MQDKSKIAARGLALPDLEAEITVRNLQSPPACGTTHLRRDQLRYLNEYLNVSTLARAIVETTGKGVWTKHETNIEQIRGDIYTDRYDELD